jgi:uncharacterized membrane protein YdbT with pleckstrin-like domain
MKTEKIQLEEDEVILLQVRKHWFVLCVQFFSVIVLALFPAVFLYLVFFSSSINLPVFNTSFVISLYAGWLIIMWMILFSVWTNYYLDVWTVTNKRLIAVDQRGFFSRTISSFRLERMQDITVTVKGIIATLLNFGTLEIQTAGVEKNFRVHGIPGPADIKSVILSSADSLIGANSKDGTGQ